MVNKINFFWIKSVRLDYELVKLFLVMLINRNMYYDDVVNRKLKFY